MATDLSSSSNNKAVNVHDVAKASGTSIATVSRVLSGSDYPVSPKTRKRVLDAAKELQYTPNLLGHMLKSKTNKCIGIIIPSFQNPFFIQLTMGIESAAKAKGYSTFVFSSRRDIETERNLISQLLQLRITSLMLSTIDNDSSVLNSYLDTGANAVVFEADFELDSRIINATSNMNENGFIATSHLLSSGHRNIAFLTTPLTKRNRQMVCKGFLSAMNQFHIKDAESDIFESTFEREMDDALFEFETGKELAKKILLSSKSYTGIVAVNDLVACGVIQGLTQNGIRVPEDISVVGIDDIPQGKMVTPSLTTVNQGSAQHGHEACLKLIHRLESGDFSPYERCYRKPLLIPRDSSRSLL